VGGDCVYFHGGSPYEADAGSLVAVYVAQARAEVALP
jgi:hypothetical protein